MAKPGYITNNFRQIIAALIISAATSVTLISAPLWYEPFRAELPDGRILNLFISGDEFFNWSHDTLGFPVKKGADGYYYFMMQDDSVFIFTPHRVGEFNPLSVSYLKITEVPSNIIKKREAFFRSIESEDKKRNLGPDSKWSGSYNNLVIYIKFNDQAEFTIPRTTYDNTFNSLTSSSVRHYYREISYGKLDMVSHHMPGGLTQNISFTDTYARNYYRPYDASTNPAGYQSDDAKRIREHDLLARAAKYVNDNFQKPNGVDFDSNNDGNFDNVAFVIRGGSDGWSDLLWPHRWVLYSQTAYLWGLKVYSYTFQLENVSMKTFSHEMFHALGAPDLYRYNNTKTPVGPWDIMASGSGHPLAWMKSKYGGWLDPIPEITQSGTYSIKPLTESAGNVFRISSPHSTNQYFLVEFRKKSGIYESKLPSEGLIITRVDSRYRGNAQGPPDELYVFRPGGAPETDGQINLANFSNTVSRTSLSDVTNPNGFLQDGSPAGVSITNITWHSDSMTFTVDLDQPTNMEFTRYGDSEMRIDWQSGRNSTFILAVSTTPEVLQPPSSPQYAAGDPLGIDGHIIYKGTSKSFWHTMLESDEIYYYTVWAVINNTDVVFSAPLTGYERTGILSIGSLPHSETFSAINSNSLPQGWKAEGGLTQWSGESNDVFSPPYSLLLRNSGTGSSILYTPGFNLTAKTNYLITFRYKAFAVAGTETVTLQSAENRHDGTMAYNTVYTDNSVPENDYVIGRAVFRATKSGPWYFGIKSATGGSGILIDDFRIEAVPASTSNLRDPEKFYPNPATEKIVVPARETTIVTIIRHDGIPILTKTIEGTSEIDISALTPGIYYIRFSSLSTNKTSKLIVTPVR
jgi:M6 family metalloprotease-like protein